MATIAAKVGGSKATLYAYFPSKEALFAAVIEQYCAADLEPVALPDDDHLAATLQALCEAYARRALSADHIDVCRLVIAESRSMPHIGPAFFDMGLGRWTARLAAVLDQARRTGRLAVNDCGQAADQLSQLCLGSLYTQRLCDLSGPPSEGRLRDMVRAGLAVFLAAYRPAAAA